MFNENSTPLPQRLSRASGNPEVAAGIAFGLPGFPLARERRWGGSAFAEHFNTIALGFAYFDSAWRGAIITRLFPDRVVAMHCAWGAY